MNRLLQNGGRSDWQLRDAEAILARARLVSDRGFGFMRAMGGWFGQRPYGSLGPRHCQIAAAHAR